MENKKCRECPAFETNEFKVGDVVEVYSFGRYGRGTVYSIDKNFHPDEVFVELEETGTKISPHFKACRKLEEIKPREFLIAINEDGEISNTDPMLKWFLLNGKPVKFVKVREVIE